MDWPARACRVILHRGRPGSPRSKAPIGDPWCSRGLATNHRLRRDPPRWTGRGSIDAGQAGGTAPEPGRLHPSYDGRNVAQVSATSSKYSGRGRGTAPRDGRRTAPILLQVVGAVVLTRPGRPPGRTGPGIRAGVPPRSNTGWLHSGSAARRRGPRSVACGPPVASGCSPPTNRQRDADERDARPAVATRRRTARRTAQSSQLGGQGHFERRPHRADTGPCASRRRPSVRRMAHGRSATRSISCGQNRSRLTGHESHDRDLPSLPAPGGRAGPDRQVPDRRRKWHRANAGTPRR